MKLWAKRGKWRLWEILEVSFEQMKIEKYNHSGIVGIPYCYANCSDGTRIYCPNPARYVQIEEEE